MFNDANLWEKFCDTESTQKDTEKIDYWTQLLGTDGIDYICGKWPQAFSKENDYINCVDDQEYIELKKYYFNSTIEIEDCIYQRYKDVNLGIFYLDMMTILYRRLKINKRFDRVIISETAIMSYLDMVFDKMLLIAGRSLIVEMTYWYSSSSNTDDPAKAYQRYSRKFLSNRQYRIKFYNNFPAVFRGILRAILYCSSNFNDFYMRINKDKEVIETSLCAQVEFSQINNLKSNISDSHCKGKSVYIIDLNNGKKIIYKPHSISNEIAYQELSNYFGIQCGIPMMTYNGVDRKEYGWTEYVAQAICSDQMELHRYYKRLGIHLFLCYLLNTSDIHAENLVAHGEHPVIVDMETLIGTATQKCSSDLNGEIHKLIRHSVLQSGILPFYIWSQEEQEGIDVSAASSRLGQTYPIKVPCIINPFRTDMKIIYKKATSCTSRNLVYLNNKIVLAGDFADHIVEMFQKAYKLAMEKREILDEYIQKFRELKIRHVMRNSQQYAMVLSSSFHPELTIDESKRHLFLYSLWQMQKCDEVIIDSEVMELLQGDIPYFYCIAGEKDLYNGNKKIIKNFFKTTAIEETEKKLNMLNVSDMKRQSSYIHISLGMTKFADLKKEYDGYSDEVDCKQFTAISVKAINMALKYGEELLESAIYSNDKSDVNWIGLKLHDGHRSDWNLKPLNMYFYEGKAGVAFYIHVLKQLSPKKYQEICEILDKSFFRHTDMMLKTIAVESVDTGALYGEASILLYYELCYKIDKNECYLEYCEKQVKILEKYFHMDNKYDLLAGNAGAIILLINLYELTKNHEHLSLAIKMGEYLLKKSSLSGGMLGWKNDINTNCLAGLSHGGSGFALSYTHLFNVTGEDKYLQVVEDILKYENSLYDEETGDWKDMREENTGDLQTNALAWCHGSAGILLARTKMYEMLIHTNLSKIIYKDIEQGAKKIMQMGLIKGNCLCHGNFGNVSILKDYGKRLGNVEAESIANSIIKIMVNQLEKEETNFLATSERFNPGFMVGATGVYYTLLKNIYEHLPSVLLLEI